LANQVADLSDAAHGSQEKDAMLVEFADARRHADQ
jgi:hypothetical protein